MVWVLVCIALSACTSTEEPLTPREQLVQDARDMLPDEELRAAIPDGFELDRVVVNDDEYHRKSWVTVGVRLKEGPVEYARAIFYVLPSEETAHAMYQRQSGFERIPGVEAPRPFEAELGIPNVCDGYEAGLLWCHATKGRVYLVTQSTAGWPPPARVTPQELLTGRMMLEAFGGYLASK